MTIGTLVEKAEGTGNGYCPNLTATNLYCLVPVLNLHLEKVGFGLRIVEMDEQVVAGGRVQRIYTQPLQSWAVVHCFNGGLAQRRPDPFGKNERRR